MTRVLITGVAGFIGRHVLDALSAMDPHEAMEIRGLDSFEPVVHGPGPYPTAICGWSTPRAIPVQHGSICEMADLKTALEGVDVVIHLAGAVSVSSSFEDPSRFVYHNEFGTAQLWRAIRDAGTVQRVVYASSMANYGEGRLTPGIGEDWPMRPLNVYAASKLGAEHLCRICGTLYDIPTVNLRLWNVFGPGQSVHNAETGVVAIWLAALLNERTPVVFEDGRQLRDLVYVTDVAKAFVLAMQTPFIGAVNIGSGLPAEVGYVATKLCRLMGKSGPTPNGRKRPGDSRHCWPDISRARQVLGWEPSVSLTDGLLQTIAWGMSLTDI